MLSAFSQHKRPFSSVQSLSHIRLFVTPWIAARQASLSITNSWSLLKLKSMESVMPSNHLILCCPLLLLPSIFPSIRVFSNESVHHIRWPKYWSFNFSISPSSDYSGPVSFRMDWFDLLAVQGTLKSLLQHHSSKAFMDWEISTETLSHLFTVVLPARAELGFEHGQSGSRAPVLYHMFLPLMGRESRDVWGLPSFSSVTQSCPTLCAPEVNLGI